MYLVPTHSGWEMIDELYTGIIATFAHILFVLIYILSCRVIANVNLGNKTRRIAYVIVHVQAFFIAGLFSLIVFVFTNESSQSTPLSLTYAFLTFALLYLGQSLLFRHQSIPIEKRVNPKKKESLFSKLKHSARTTCNEVFMIFSEMKQDKKLRGIRITIAYLLSLIFCLVFAVPAGILSVWLFRTHGSVLLIPASLIITITVDQKIKKRWVSNQGMDPTESGSEFKN